MTATQPQDLDTGKSLHETQLITGITGQDGSYLAEFLLSKPDYEVHGLVRRSSSLNRQRIDHLFAVTLGPAIGFISTTPTSPMRPACRWSWSRSGPTRSITWAAQSHVRVSFDQPLYTADVVGLGTLAAARGGRGT